MRCVFIVFAALLLAGVAGLSARQEKPKEPQAPAGNEKIPAEAAQKPNPVKPTPSGLAEARRVYGFDCAMCHGKNGDGKGDLTADMKLVLRDWRDPAALAGKTDGELFYVITKGKGQMIGEGGRVPDEHCWQLVNLVRSFAKKEAEKDKEKVKEKEEAPKPPATAETKPPAALR